MVPKIKIAFDIDGTLIDIVGDSPRYDIINMLLNFSKSTYNTEIYIWSGGGLDYAERWKYKLGLPGKVIEKGSIPVDIAFNDELVTLGKVNIQV